MNAVFKNIPASEAVDLSQLVEIRQGEVVSRTLAQTSKANVTLFAFSKGEAISSHVSDGDAVITVLEGKGKITIGEKEQVVSAGETILMPANIPHAVEAAEDFKMFLLVIFPES